MKSKSYRLIITYLGSKKSNMFNIGQNYDKLWQAIIRPPRALYKREEVGPTLFRKNGLKITRKEVQLTNKRGHKLICSHYEPYVRPCKQLPCVIYLHGNSSCQVEAQHCLSAILCHDATLFAFDFSGCGLSQGEYISLGYHEREDVDAVFQYLRGLGTVSSIGIWGRSMGAVTALMYADRNPQIGCLVLDSPFSNLEDLCKQLAKKYVSGMAAFSGIALTFLSKTIKEKNSFNIEDISPIKHVKNAYIPALFIAAKDDDFILPHHTDKLHSKYAGEKQKILAEGDHNSRRAQQINDKISSFFFFGLYMKDLIQPDENFIAEQKLAHKQQQKQKQSQAEIMPFNIAEIEMDNEGGFQDNEDELAKALEESLKIHEQIDEGAKNNENPPKKQE